MNFKLQIRSKCGQGRVKKSEKFVYVINGRSLAHLLADEKKEDVESGPEEEEVPTRGYLKRQANLIVDAKSRSKRGNRRR